MIPRIKEPTMRVFVAGATGVIGKQLVPRLVAEGHDVHGMTRRESKQAMLRLRGAVPVADALDHDQVAHAAARAKPEVIVHQLTALAGWQPALARIRGARQPMQAPRLAAGEAGAVLITLPRAASNANAKRELGWLPWHPSWRQGFAK